jgi:hypothetical protein
MVAPPSPDSVIPRSAEAVPLGTRAWSTRRSRPRRWTGRLAVGLNECSTLPGVATADGGALARLRFEPDWRETLEGEIEAGGRLVIEYAAERRHQLFGGRMAGEVVAYVLFAPGGERPSGPVGSGPLVLEVPAGATEVALWFGATDHAGREVWDSRWGQNHRYRVAPRPA